MKLSSVQLFKLRQALVASGAVLNEVKQQPLRGESLTFMKTLEESVVALEAALVMKPAQVKGGRS